MYDCKSKKPSVTVNATEEPIAKKPEPGLSGPLEYRLTNDYLFRAVFQECPEALNGLVRALLGLDENAVASCKIENPIMLGEHIDEKTSILDIRILFNNSKYINLEMQVANFEAWPERSLYYLCKLFTNLAAGTSYEKVMPAIHIGILDFAPFPDDVDFYSRYMITNIETGYVYSDKFMLNVLNLSQINQVPPEKRNTELYSWAKLFKSRNWEEIRMLAEQSKTIEDVEAALKKFMADKDIRLQCEARERYERDRATYDSLKMRLKKQQEDIARQQEAIARQQMDIALQREDIYMQQEDISMQREDMAQREAVIAEKEAAIEAKLRELQSLEKEL